MNGTSVADTQLTRGENISQAFDRIVAPRPDSSVEKLPDTHQKSSEFSHIA